jgi:hypothetical protein
MTAAAVEASETSAMKAAGARSAARSETLRYPSMVEAAEGAGARPAKSTRMQSRRTNTASEVAWMTKFARTTKPAGRMAPESRTVRNVR